MLKGKAEKRVVMARAIAARWLKETMKAEYRLRVLSGSREYKNLPNLMRMFRDGRVGIEGVATIPDLGIKTNFDSLEVWSGNFASMRQLNEWFEAQGFETTGIW